MIATDEQINKQQEQAAQLRLDADAGREYLRNLAAKHFEQGYFAGSVGLDPDAAGLYSVDHKRGYAAACAGLRPVYQNVGGLPALARS